MHPTAAPARPRTRSSRLSRSVSYTHLDVYKRQHVERITQLVSFQACYRIIEFMKNGESVIVNTESIANEAEVIRCIDMLSGAAYTLGLSLIHI